MLTRTTEQKLRSPGQDVRAQLIALALSAGQITQATGAGTGGKSLAACMVDGHLDEAICAQLRRVVIVLSPAPR
jgi:hypothetical protein